MEVFYKYRWVLAVLGVCLGLIFVSVFARYIVGHSYSAEGYIAEKENTGSDAEKPEIEEEKDFSISKDTKDGKTTVSQMYEESSVEEDTNALLEGNTGTALVVDSIAGEYESVMSGVPSIENKMRKKAVSYSYDEYPMLDSSEVIEEGVYTVLKGVTVVGLYGGNKVLYSYGFPESNFYIFVDYEGVSFLDDTEETWKIGDIKDVGIDPDRYTIKDIEGYSVIFTRG